MSASKNKSAKNNTKIVPISLAIIIVALIGVFLLINNNSKSNKATNENNTQVVTDSDLKINVSDITETAKFYPVQIDGTKLEVIAVKAPDGSIRTAFNTCQVCFSSGRGYYVQEGDKLVCQNCGNRFGMGDVEVSRGGCNPVPITDSDKTVTNTTITISNQFLAASKEIFANWKS